jgi:hypothetical protein
MTRGPLAGKTAKGILKIDADLEQATKRAKTWHADSLELHSGSSSLRSTPGNPAPRILTCHSHRVISAVTFLTATGFRHYSQPIQHSVVTVEASGGDVVLAVTAAPSTALSR